MAGRLLSHLKKAKISTGYDKSRQAIQSCKIRSIQSLYT